MEELRVKVNDADIYVLRSDVTSDRGTILCVHGLGESHLCYSEAFHLLRDFNVVALDLPGFGNSRPSSGKHDTASQATRVLQIIDGLKIEDVTLIGHSWGADVGIVMCDIDKGNRIKRYINVEGDVHRENVIMSETVAKIFRTKKPEDFRRWLLEDGFPEEIVLKSRKPAGIRYLTSLRLCEPRICGETASEINRMHSEADDDGVTTWGKTYARLEIPTVYCWGTKSLKDQDGVKRFIRPLNNQPFSGAGHWVMIDSSEEFYGFVGEFTSAG